MIQIRDERCIGCGLCVNSCPTGAITLSFSKARINSLRCINCQTCVSVCPMGAIGVVFASELDELKTKLKDLKRRMNWLSGKLDQLTPRK